MKPATERQEGHFPDAGFQASRVNDEQELQLPNGRQNRNRSFRYDHEFNPSVVLFAERIAGFLPLIWYAVFIIYLQGEKGR